MSAIISALQAELDEAAYIVWISCVCQGIGYHIQPFTFIHSQKHPVAGTALVLWDHFITLDQEIERVWRRFCLGTALYAIIRYVGDAAVIISAAGVLVPRPTKLFCEVTMRLQLWLSLIVLLSLQIVLQTRIYALSCRSNKTLAFMAVFFLAEMAVLIYILTEATQIVEVAGIPFTNIQICVAPHALTLSQYLWLSVLCFEGLLFFLVLWVGFRHRYSGFRRKFFGRTIFETLIRGNVFYFACVLAGCLFDEIVYKLPGVNWLQVPYSVSGAGEVVVGCRLILNLHAALLRDTISET